MYFTGSGQINLPASSALCVLALHTASSSRAVLNKVGVFFNGTSATAVPVNAVIARITNTPSGSSVPTNYGPNCCDDAGPAATVTALVPTTASPGTWTTAPTQGAIVWEAVIPPTTGDPEWWPLGQEIKAGTSKWVGLFLTAQAAVSVWSHIYHTE
jgi:hypothetical protein